MIFARTVCLLLSAVAAIGGTFTSSGTASQECEWFGRVPPVAPDQYSVTRAITGTSATFSACPPTVNQYNGQGAYYGPILQASLSNFVGSAETNALQIFHTGNVMFSFQNTFVDTLVAQGGMGTGTAEFTITWDWTELNDGGGRR
ncbi:MAG TPA: hypothetical protein VGV35_06590 [Bryobacteraceae bacterium]|nr:hypothetical protein [Bryobacteraceae bacterium]